MHFSEITSALRGPKYLCVSLLYFGHACQQCYYYSQWYDDSHRISLGHLFVGRQHVWDSIAHLFRGLPVWEWGIHHLWGKQPGPRSLPWRASASCRQLGSPLYVQCTLCFQSVFFQQPIFDRSPSGSRFARQHHHQRDPRSPYSMPSWGQPNFAKCSQMVRGHCSFPWKTIHSLW